MVTKRKKKKAPVQELMNGTNFSFLLAVVVKNSSASQHLGHHIILSFDHVNIGEDSGQKTVFVYKISLCRGKN